MTVSLILNIFVDYLDEQPDCEDYPDYIESILFRSIDTYVGTLPKSSVNRIRDEAEEDKEFWDQLDKGMVDLSDPEQYRLQLAFCYFDYQLRNFMESIQLDHFSIQNAVDYKRFIKSIRKWALNKPIVRQTKTQRFLEDKSFEINLDRIRECGKTFDYPDKLLFLSYGTLKVFSIKNKRRMNKNALVLEGNEKDGVLTVKRLYVMDSKDGHPEISLDEVEKKLRECRTGKCNGSEYKRDYCILNRW